MMPKQKFSKIMIFGRPGSGKSTFSLKLHKNTGIPLYHIDKYFFTHNWAERNRAEFMAIQQSFVDKDTWIIDGNSIKSLETRYSKADLVLHFVYPRWICYWRIFKRIFKKDKQIDDRAEGCIESVSWKLLKYMWSHEQRVAEPIAYLRDKYPDAKFIEVRKGKDLANINKLLTFI